MSDKINPSLMDIEQAAQYLNISVSYIYKLVAKKGIPHVRIASKILFKQQDLDKWVEKRKVNVSKVA